MTIREQVAAAFAARMGAVRGLPTRSDLDLPATVMVEGEDQVERVQYGSVTTAMALTVERVQEVVASAPTEANAALGDLIATATGTDRTLGGLALDIEYHGGGIDVPQDGSSILGARATFRVRYQFDVGAPGVNSQ